MTQDELVFNERSKLKANYWNTLAASCFTVGVLTPVITLLVYATTSIEPQGLFTVATILYASLCLSALLRQQAAEALGGLIL